MLREEWREYLFNLDAHDTNLCVGLYLVFVYRVESALVKRRGEYNQSFRQRREVMLNTGKLAGKTLYITGASRGIGLDIAKKAARDGANVVIAAKTAEPHPKLPGTIFTAAKQIEDLGGKALPVVVDVRSARVEQKSS